MVKRPVSFRHFDDDLIIHSVSWLGYGPRANKPPVTISTSKHRTMTPPHGAIFTVKRLSRGAAVVAILRTVFALMHWLVAVWLITLFRQLLVRSIVWN